MLTLLKAQYYDESMYLNVVNTLIWFKSRAVLQGKWKSEVYHFWGLPWVPLRGWVQVCASPIGKAIGMCALFPGCPSHEAKGASGRQYLQLGQNHPSPGSRTSCASLASQVGKPIDGPAATAWWICPGCTSRTFHVSRFLRLRPRWICSGHVGMTFHTGARTPLALRLALRLVMSQVMSWSHIVCPGPRYASGLLQQEYSGAASEAFFQGA